MMGAGETLGSDLGKRGFASQDHTAGGKLGNPIGQPLVRMGNLRPREGKGFTQSHRESYTAKPAVLSWLLAHGSFQPHCLGQERIWGGSLGLPHILEVEGVKNIHAYVLSCVVSSERVIYHSLCHHKMVRCLPHARRSVLIEPCNNDALERFV